MHPEKGVIMCEMKRVIKQASKQREETDFVSVTLLNSKKTCERLRQRTNRFYWVERRHTKMIQKTLAAPLQPICPPALHARITVCSIRPPRSCCQCHRWSTSAHSWPDLTAQLHPQPLWQAGFTLRGFSPHESINIDGRYGLHWPKQQKHVSFHILFCVWDHKLFLLCGLDMLIILYTCYSHV